MNASCFLRVFGFKGLLHLNQVSGTTEVTKFKYPDLIITEEHSKVGVLIWITTGNSGIDKAETRLVCQEHYSLLQDMVDALSCHVHLCIPGEAWTLISLQKNTKYVNEVLLSDSTHLRGKKAGAANKEVHANVYQVINSHNDLLTFIQRCKLQ